MLEQKSESESNEPNIKRCKNKVEAEIDPQKLAEKRILQAENELLELVLDDPESPDFRSVELTAGTVKNSQRIAEMRIKALQLLDNYKCTLKKIVALSTAVVAFNAADNLDKKEDPWRDFSKNTAIAQAVENLPQKNRRNFLVGYLSGNEYFGKLLEQFDGDRKKAFTQQRNLVNFIINCENEKNFVDIERSLIKEVNETEKRIIFKKIEELKIFMIKHIGSVEYLQKLTKEFGGNIEKAKDVQKYRMDYLKKIKYSFIDGDIQNPAYSPEWHKAYLSGNKFDYDAVVHEFFHASIPFMTELPEKTFSLFKESFQKSGDEKTDRYLGDIRERIARKQAFDLELEDLGIKRYGEKFTKKHYEMIIDAYVKGKLSPGGRQFVESTKLNYEYFEKIFNEIAKNDSGSQDRTMSA